MPEMHITYQQVNKTKQLIKQEAVLVDVEVEVIKVWWI